MTDYRVVVADLDGTPMDELPAQNLQYSYSLDGPGSINFTVPILHSKSTLELLDPGARELHVYRNDGLVWGGYLWFLGASAQGDARCSGEGWFSMLFHRLIDQDRLYQDEDQFDIAWDLIDFTQSKTNGDLGITQQAVAASGVTRTFSYWAFQRPNLGEAIMHLHEVENGMDFEITPDKRWIAYYPERGTTVDTPFELGKNVSGLSFELDANRLMTEVTGIGAGEGQDTLISVKSDAPSQTRYNLLQESITNKDITDTTLLSDSAMGHLEANKTPRFQPEIAITTNDPPFGSYSVGDHARLKADHGLITIDAEFRIIAIVVAVTNEGRDAISVFFDGEPT